MAKNDRIVSRRPDGKWVNKKEGASKASSVHDTQQAAISSARQMLSRSGGGELRVKDPEGRIRTKDTISTTRDPLPADDPHATAGSSKEIHLAGSLSISGSVSATLRTADDPPTVPELVAAIGPGAADDGSLAVVADLDTVPPELVAQFMAALDKVHRAFGGSGLVIADDRIGVADAATVPT